MKLISIIFYPLRLLWRGFAWFFRRRPWYVKILSSLLMLVVAIVLYLGAVDIDLFGLFGRSPSMLDVRNTRPPQASEIYSDDGVMIGKFFSENRTPVTYKDVSPAFWQALIDTEDERFYSHPGVDIPSLFAAMKDYVVKDDPRGASTLTQQLAKNLFRMRSDDYSTGLLGRVPGMRMLVVKSKEWVTAMKLEWNFSKEEILTMYANTVDFGSNAYGINTASKTYFGVAPSELKPEQAAVLVGMLKATTTYNPRLHPEQSMQRRNVVLQNMLAHGHLTQQQYDTLSVKPIELDYRVEKVYDGLATYFREAIVDEMRPWCRSRRVDLYADGLKIYTTIDTRLQQYAEEAAREQMRQVQASFNSHWAQTTPWRDAIGREIPNFIENIAQRTDRFKELQKRFGEQTDSIWHYMNERHPVKVFSYDGPVEYNMSTMDSIRYMVRFMHCGFVVMEPDTRYVRAWVGDLDFDTWKYDKVTALRQPGSTFKLFVYTEAMQQGLTPCTTRSDSYVSIGDWHPHNADGTVSDSYMTLRVAFARSINTVAAKLGNELGIDRVANTARKMGIKSHLEEVPSLALGASDVSLLELLNSYATVVNDGRMGPPVLVSRILDRDGNEIYRASNEQEQAISYRSAFLMQQMLMACIHGTSWNLRQYIAPFMGDTDFGGKTGTSNNHSDAWFMGVTPHLVCGAWVGGEYRAIHFRTGALGQGNVTALPICGLFFRKVFSDDRFSYYRVKFKPCQDASISSNQWLCGAGYTPVDTTLSPGEYHFDDEEDEEEQQDYYDETPEADGNEE